MPKTKTNPAEMQIESLNIQDLEHDAKNAREHGHHNIEAIKESLRRWGQQKPIVIDLDNVVIAGNGTLAAAREMGWKQIQTVRTDLNEAEKLGYAIADNRTAELADWDEVQLAATLQDIAQEDIESTGFSVNDLNKLVNRISKTLELNMPHDEQTQGLVSQPGGKGMEAPPSHVRMVQLYFDTETIEVYLDALKDASDALGTDNPTDTVLAALKKVAGHEND